MLHITDGESVAGTLREAAVPGDVVICGLLLYEGPTDDTLPAFPQHDEVVIWLDCRLSDQLILIKLLDWFSRRNPGAVKLTLIDHFATLGALTADRLASLADTRLPVTDEQFRLAQAAWSAFTSPDPTAIERLINGDTAALPFLAAAFQRHLEQFPSVDGGLSRTERQALSILREQGPLPQAKLFVAVQRMEEQIFMGDCSFYRIIAELSAGPHPLVQTDLENVTITHAGRNVLDGRADHIELNGIDRWLGGVHLKGNQAAWRWDRTAARLMTY
jgi:hypothetical protein